MIDLHNVNFDDLIISIHNNFKYQDRIDYDDFIKFMAKWLDAGNCRLTVVRNIVDCNSWAINAATEGERLVASVINILFNACKIKKQ